MSILYGPGRRVVVGVDGSAESEQLLRWADSQAELTRSVVLAVTGWQSDLPGTAGAADRPGEQTRLQRMLTETIRSALSPERAALVKERVSLGPPTEALLAQAAKADLVAVGPRSSSRVAGLMLGSVAERVLVGATCPVAVVHANRHPPTLRIAVGVDGSDCSRRALEWAIRQSHWTGSTVDVLAVQDAGSLWLAPPYAAWATPQQWVAHVVSGLPADVEGAGTSTHVCPGQAAEVLLHAADTADMIVVGNRGTGFALSRLLGSVSQRVAREASVPVVVVHSDDHRLLSG